MTAQAEAIEPIKFQPRRLGHANLWVSDINAITNFYHHVVGLRVEAIEPGIKASFLGNGNTHHDIGTVEITHGEDRVGRDGQVLINKDVSGQLGLFHFGWEMENEAQLVDAIKRAQAKGQDYAMIVDHQISHSIYLADPDGNLMEFYADMLKDWQSIFHGDMDLITGNWSPGEETPITEAFYHQNPTLYGVDDAPVHPLRISRAVIAVGDFETSYGFYTDVAGLDTIYKASDYAFLRGTAGRYDLALYQALDSVPVGLHHITFDLANEAAVETAGKALRERGLRIIADLDTESKRSIFIRDPDGLKIEFAVARQPDYEAMGKATPAVRPYLA